MTSEAPDAALEAADALEAMQADIGKLLEALRYFVYLANDRQRREIAEIRRNLANTKALIDSSDRCLPKVRELVTRLRLLAAEEALLPPTPDRDHTSMHVPLPDHNEQDGNKPNADRPEQNARPPLMLQPTRLAGDNITSTARIPSTNSTQSKEHDEQDRANMVLSEIECLLRIDGRNATSRAVLTNSSLVESQPNSAASRDHQQLDLRRTDPLNQEMDVLLGGQTATIFSEMEEFLTSRAQC
jgi:hypothetical protein